MAFYEEGKEVAVRNAEGMGAWNGMMYVYLRPTDVDLFSTVSAIKDFAVDKYADANRSVPGFASQS